MTIKYEKKKIAIFRALLARFGDLSNRAMNWNQTLELLIPPTNLATKTSSNPTEPPIDVDTI